MDTSTTNQNELGKRIKQLRRQLGYTQTQLASLIGTSHAAVSQWENGENDIAESNMQKLKEVTKVNLKWLKEGRGDMFVEGPDNALRVAPHESRFIPEKNMPMIVLSPDGRENCAIVPIKVFANYTYAFQDDIFFRSLKYMTTPPWLSSKGTIRVFEVSGDSMTPNVKDGNKVYASFVPFGNIRELKEAVSINNIYVAVTIQGIYLKRIAIPDPINEPIIQLLSDNKTVGTMDIDPEDIREVWKVEEICSTNIPGLEEESAEGKLDFITHERDNVKGLIKDLDKTVKNISSEVVEKLSIVEKEVRELVTRLKK